MAHFFSWFIASLFLFIGGAMFYEGAWGDLRARARGALNSYTRMGSLTMLPGVLVFVWACRKK